MQVKARSHTNIKSYKDAAELPAAWDELLPEGHFLQRTGLRITQKAQLPDVSFVYVLVSVNDVEVAAAYFQVLQLSAKHINAAMVKPMARFAWNSFSAIAKPKLVIAGHLFRHDIQSYYYQPGIPAFDAYQFYQQAIKEALRSSCGMAVLVKDAEEALTPYFQNYGKYMPLRNDISMEMEIDSEWGDIKGYEKSLKHKYAQRYRKVRQQWEGVVVKELSLQEISANKARIYALYKQVTERQQVRLGFLSEDFIPTLKQHYEQGLKVWGVYEGDKMVAFFSAWHHPHAFDMFYIGLDYERNNDLQLYFNMLFFGIEQAIENKMDKLILGRTALEAKARLGCKPKYLSTFLYIKNSFIRNRIMQVQQNAYLQEGEWEQRHPFKK